jgi:tRNA(adenine34) deaminase
VKKKGVEGSGVEGSSADSEIALSTPRPFDSSTPSPLSSHPQHERYLREALGAARDAAEHGDVPVGAVIVRDEDVIAVACNRTIRDQDPTAHAELLAIRDAARRVRSWRLNDCSLYVTLEPCAMCAGAIVLGRVPRVVYAADDPKAGAAGSVLDVLAEPRLNHRPVVARGLLAEEAAELLRAFFASRR